MHTLFGTGFHQILCDHFHRCLDLSVCIKVSVVRKTVKSFSAVHPFDLRKAGLNWIKLRTVRYVFNFDDVQLFVLLLDFFTFMYV